VPIVGY